MYLRRLEINGFKSFARRTQLEFAPGVTAIVGPNGTGKSNVADAIRWSMGEQSMRTLRGSKTEDVIFGGGDGRPRSGVAEVTITFDNADHWLPIEFEEVSVTRRAFRSGENEYRLNGSRVRLKDIQELLRSGGIALGGNMVIGQGEVDAALSLRPEHRRLLLEEGAGVSRYYARRDDARRRLDQTGRNLQRLSDLHAELGPRLEVLREQAEVASRSNELAADLQEKSRSLLAHRLALAIGVEETALASRAEAESRLAEFEAQSGETDAIVTEPQVEAARAAAARAEAEHEELRTRFNDLTAAARLASQRIEFEERAVTDLDTRLAAASEAQTSAVAVVAQAEADLAELEEVCSHLEAEIGDAGPEPPGEEQIASLQASVAEARRAAAELAGDIARVQEAQQSLASRQTENDNDAAGAAGDLQASHKDLVSRQAEVVDAGRRVRESESRSVESRQVRDRAVVRVKELRSELERARTEALENRAVIEGMRAEIQAISTAGAESVAARKGISALLGNAERLRVRGLLRSGFLTIPPELSRAVDAALGHLLEDVVIDRVEDLGDAIAFLRRDHDARVRFRPSAGFPDRPRRPWPFGGGPPDGPGVIGTLDGLISARPEFEAALLPLFRTIVVVDHLDTALGLRASDRHAASYRLVTLDGELVDPDGSVLVGKWDEETVADLSARAAELEAGMEGAEASLAAATEHERLNQEALETAVADEERANEDLEAATLFDAGTRSGLRGAEEELNLARRQEGFWSALVERIAATSDDIASRQEAGRLRLVELQAGIEPAREAVESAEESLAASQRLVSASGINEIRSRLTLEKERLQNARSRLTAQQSAVETATRDSERYAAEVAAARERLDSARAEAESSDAEARTVQTGLPALAEAAESSRNQISELEFSRRQTELVQRARAVERGEITNAICAAGDRAESAHQRVTDIRERILQELGADQLEPQRYSRPIGELEAEIDRHRRLGHEVGPVNPLAPQQFEEEGTRYHDLGEQIQDMEQTVEELRKLTSELESAVQSEFMQTFEQIRAEFRKYFRILFGGGDADIVLSEPEEPAASGIEITAQLPGKRAQRLEALSGGERSLVSIALLFAMFSARPGPLCVLDEVDAALDEANTVRFRRILHDFAGRTQFVVITHNPGTIEEADSIFGVSMPANGVSQLVSIRMNGLDGGGASAGVEVSSGA